jgi:membrane protease YdiL (CAAX protease family)
MQTNLDLARQGKNEWWRFLAAVILILFLWQFVGAVPGMILIFWTQLDGNPGTNITPQGPVGVNLLVYFAAMMFASILFLAGIALAVRWIHERPLRTLITPAPRFAWGRFLQGFLVWLLISGVVAGLEGVLHPGRYKLTFDLRQYLPFVFLAILLVPIQTSAEELFFRGYLLQGFGLRVRNIWLLSLISGLLFGLPHLLNPEAKINYGIMGLFYVFIGAVLAFVTLRDGRMELALGLHAANNLFSALLVNYVVTVMPTPAVFTVQKLDVVFGALVPMVGLVVFVLLFAGPWHRRREGDPTGPVTG